MRPRRPSRARRRDALYRAVQCHRLQGIAKGEIEPLSAREQYFLWALEAHGRVECADFIIPGLLYMAERRELEIENAPESVAALEAPHDAEITSS